jgi:phage/plasmid-like protein (TIGR03299 family)
MAHDLKIKNGEASMFYVGEPPWHGLGTRLKDAATAAEAMTAAKLDWSVVRKPIFAGDSSGLFRVPEQHAIVPEDRWGKEDCPIFGIVGRDYTPVQNREAFEFFDAIVGDDAAIYHTAGALGEGERIWILAKLPEDIRVIGDDVAEKYLLLSNSHDGRSSVQMKFTPIRVVCQNTLTQALSKGPTLKLRHGKDVHARLNEAHRLLGIISDEFNKLEECFQAMTRVSMTASRLTDYLDLVFPDPQNPDDERALRRAQTSRFWSSHFFDNGRGNRLPGVAGTLWAAYNGVTEYTDHRRTNQTDDRRLEAIWFGEGYLAKARAFTVAEDRLRAWTN